MDAKLSELVNFRTSSLDLVLLRAVAHRQGVTLSEFIRRAVRAEAERQLREKGN